MKVIVTGATGFVGKWLVNELLYQKDDVTIIVRNKEKVPQEWRKCLHIVEASLEQISGLGQEDFYDEEADILFHLAWSGVSGTGRTDSQLQLQNVNYTCDMVKLAEKLQCSRFVNAGSVMEYEAMQSIPRENTKPGMRTIYGTAKLTADFMAKAIAANAGIEYINLIISNIYGVGDCSTRFLNTTLEKMMNHQQIPLTHGEQLYDFIYVSDAVKAMALVGKKGEKYSAYYIGNAKQYPLNHFVRQMKKTMESDSQLLFGQVPFMGAMLEYNEFDTEKVEKLGFKPKVGFAQGIELTRKWMLEGKKNNKF